MTPQVHSFEDGSNRPMRMTVFPYHRALYSNWRTNSDHPASEIDLARLRFLSIPDTFKSSSATAWFSRMIREDSLCRKSCRWFLTFSCASAKRMRCFALFLLPLTLRDSFRCSAASFASDAFRKRGEGTFSPLLRVAKVDSPKSMPSMVFSVNLTGVGTSLPVSTSTDTKCFPDGSRDTVQVLTVPLNRCEQANLIGVNLGNRIVSSSPLMTTLLGHWNDCLPRRFLNFGKPVPFLKKSRYDFSRLRIWPIRLSAFTSRSHSVPSMTFRTGRRADNCAQLILLLDSCQSFMRKANASLNTQRQAPKCFDSKTFCFSLG